MLLASVYCPAQESKQQTSTKDLLMVKRRFIGFVLVFVGEPLSLVFTGVCICNYMICGTVPSTDNFQHTTCHQDSVNLIKVTPKLSLYWILASHSGKFLEVCICRTMEGSETIRWSSTELELKIECMICWIHANLTKPESYITATAASQRMSLYWSRLYVHVAAQYSAALGIYGIKCALFWRSHNSIT